MKIEGDLGFARLISNTSFFKRKEETGYDGTLYNLGFYQQGVFLGPGNFLNNANGQSLYPLLDGNGVHLPPGATDYRSPASIDNEQENFTQEIRLQSSRSDGGVDLDHGPVFQPRSSELHSSRSTTRC